mgnify:CR=1 FL=1
MVIASSDGPVSRGGSNAAFNTRLTHELGLDFTREEIEPIFQEIFASNSFRLDQEKWWLVYNESGKAMNWLMDKMEPYGISAVIENNQRDGGTDWWDGGPLKNAERIPLLRRRGRPSGRRVAADSSSKR